MPGRDYLTGRLAQTHPHMHRAVLDGELTANAAAEASGVIRRRRTATVNITDAEAAARSLRSNMQPETLTELRRLLDDSAWTPPTTTRCERSATRSHGDPR